MREAANLKKGERLMAIAIDDVVVLKKIIDKSIEETMKPVWAKVRQMGLSEKDINALIDYERAKNSSCHQRLRLLLLQYNYIIL